MGALFSPLPSPLVPTFPFVPRAKDSPQLEVAQGLNSLQHQLKSKSLPSLRSSDLSNLITEIAKIRCGRGSC